MSKRKTKHLRAMRVPNINAVCLIDVSTNKFAWYADSVGEYLTATQITWTEGDEDMLAYYNNWIALGATPICL